MRFPILHLLETEREKVGSITPLLLQVFSVKLCPGLALNYSFFRFDMAVNGGGGVTLQFQRSPLKPTTRTTYLPWNKMVVINPVIMTPHGGAGISWSEEDTSSKVKYSQPCLNHDYTSVFPVILSSHIPGLASAPTRMTDPGGVLVELGQIQDSVRIPGTRDLHLVYRSSSALGSKSTIDMLLTPEGKPLPQGLQRVHANVRVAGDLYKKVLEPDVGLRYTFAWDKRNTYNQKVYGLVEAEVSVGYEYSECAHILWNSQMVKIKGFDVDISNTGSWNLNIHHHYNPYQGKGKKIERDISVVFMGNE